MDENTAETLYTKKDGYYAGTRAELFPFCPTSCKRVLDVGCGMGRFGKSIKDAYHAEVWGIDISEEAIQSAAMVLDKAFCADIAAALQMLPDSYFDTIFFNDVLEHLVDPDSLLRTIASKLAPGAVIVASIPNIRHYKVLHEILLKKDFKYVDAGILDRTHLRFFTRKSMVRMFESAGYRVLDTTPINRSKSAKPILYNLLSLGLIGNDIRYHQYVVRAARP
ncbi:MAG: class I SAM-dependent methyltransferase [bacterium]